MPSRNDMYGLMMKNRLTDEYRCYQDKGNVSVKLGKLQNAVKVGLEQLRKPSQTAAELKITARKLYDIADHALRLATEETIVQRAKQKQTSVDERLANRPQIQHHQRYRNRKNHAKLHPNHSKFCEVKRHRDFGSCN